MPRGVFPQPVHHDTVTMPLPGFPEGMRVVLTSEGPLPSLVSFLESRTDCGPSYQRKAASAVGLLYDYWVATTTDPAPGPWFLHRFAKALRRGTVDIATGRDPLDLYWPPAGIKRTREILRFVTAFGDHCALMSGTQPLNQFRVASFAERVARYKQLDAQNNHSMLKHLGSRKERWEEAAKVRAVAAPRSIKKAKRAPKHFPLDRTPDLLWQGFRRSTAGPFWEQYRIRDLMIAVLQRFGGLRQSEPFHLYVGDVEPAVRDIGDADFGIEAAVYLYKPSDGQVRYVDPLTRKTLVTSRAAYLQSVWQRRPRDLMYFHGEYAGWKDLMVDDGPENRAQVYWFPRIWGSIFWRLYDMYLRHVRPSGLPHPYLFVNQPGDGLYSQGSPYRIRSYEQQFRNAVRRIGLVPAKQFGTTSHGLRHAYAQVFSRLEMDRKSLQIFMHHKSPESQDVYTQADTEQARRNLDAAMDRMQFADDWSTGVSPDARLLLGGGR